MTSNVRMVKCQRCRRVLVEPSDVPVYECGGCGAKLLAKKRNNSTVDTTSQKPDEDSSGKLKLNRVFVDQEASSSSNQQSVLNSTNESDQNSNQNDLHSSNKYQDAAKRAENGTVNAPPSIVEEYSSETLQIKQLSDNQEPCSYEPDQNIQNEPRSSTEFSGLDDPESSPETTTHNRIDQDQEQNQKQNQSYYEDAGKQQETDTVAELEHPSDKQQIKQFSGDNETGSRLTQLLLVNSSELSYHDDTESSPEATFDNSIKQHETESEEATVNTCISDSDCGSKSSFKNMIAEKLLDTRQKEPVYLNEDDLLSEDGSADLRHRKRFGRLSSVVSTETARFGGTSYYGYEGSVSSFDGIDDQNPRNNRTGSIRDEHIDSGNRYRFYRSTDVRSFYGLNDEKPRYRSPMILENPSLERIELLKLVRELQDQLERTNISNHQQVPSYGQRTAFSGDATAVNRRRDGGTCHHCCPQDRHLSAQLPRHHVRCNGPNYEPNTYHSPRFSGPSSPKHKLRNHSISESEFSVPDDHWQHNDVMKPKKKKQYVRPIAGGSPWIACYRCFKLLQLPQSFLLFNKRYHSLRCGSCLKVLNFTLSNGTHVSRYYPEETIAAPPSSEVEDFDKLTGPWAGPVSCSDRSFEKSYSTETDRNGSREFGEERRKATMSRDPSGSTRPPSPKVSGRRTNASEIEEVGPGPGPNGSPLHWLMGYASPSKVIRGL